MARDLLLGNTRRNWSRGSDTSLVGSIPEGATGYAPTTWWTKDQAEKKVQELHEIGRHLRHVLAPGSRRAVGDGVFSPENDRNQVVKISSPLNQVAEVKQAIRDARKADRLAEQAAMRVFEVFRALKFDTPTGPPSAIARLDMLTISSQMPAPPWETPSTSLKSSSSRLATLHQRRTDIAHDQEARQPGPRPRECPAHFDMLERMRREGEADSHAKFEATVAKFPLPDWVMIGDVLVLRAGKSRFVGVPRKGKKTSATSTSRHRRPGDHHHPVQARSLRLALEGLPER